MGSYDVKRLDVAIQYINRMTSGRNPVTNRPAPENEVLVNPNVHRCLQFISEVLQDVRSQGGIVGKPPGRSGEAKASIAQTFPYDALKEYQYIQDQQISYFLKQISELSTEEREVPAVPALHINNWLREKGYLEKRMIPEFGKEASVPTEKGTQIGIYSEQAGVGSNLYYRIWFNEQAQRFLIDHFREILTETEEIRARKKQERKAHQGEKKKTEQTQGQSRNQAQGQPPEWTQGQPQNQTQGQTQGQPRYQRQGQSQEWTQERTQKRAHQKADRMAHAPGNQLDDPALSSLLANLPDMDPYDPAFGPDDGFFGEGWETVGGDTPF